MSAIKTLIDGAVSALAVKFVPTATISSTNVQDAVEEVRTATGLRGLKAGETWTGTHDFGGATLEIPNSAAPSVTVAGQIAVDTTIASHTGLIKYHDGVEELTGIALPTANLTTTNAHTIKYNSVNSEFEMGALDDADIIAAVSATNYTPSAATVEGHLGGIDTKLGSVLVASNNLSDVGSAATAFGNIKQAASDTTTGVVELATTAETNTGTDTARAVTPDGLAGSNYGTAIFPVLVFDDSQDCAVGDGAGDLFIRIPSTLNGFNLVEVAASVQTAGTTGTMDIQIHNVTDAVDMLSTKLTIDSAETDSSTAATAAVINASNDDVATGDQIRIDVDAVHTTPARGLFVELQFRLP